MDQSEAPKVEVPSGRPPKRVVVRDLKTGTGAVLKPGQRMGVNYIGVNYETGKPFETHWNERTGPTSFRFGTGETVKGWEIGLKGMRVGGRRELIVPSRFAYDTGALIYVVELLSAGE